MTLGDHRGTGPQPAGVSRRRLLQGAGGTLVGLGAATGAASADGEPSVRYLSCTSVRITGSAAEVELTTGYFVEGESGGFATDVKSFGPVSGATVLDADDVYPDGREFYVASVTLFDESFDVLASAQNPDESECLDAIRPTTTTPTPLEHHFYGCSQVCVNQSGVDAVVSTGDGLVCRSITRQSSRNDPAVRGWGTVRCRSVGDGEAVVGLCHGGGFVRNSNRCADNYRSDGFDCGDC